MGIPYSREIDAAIEQVTPLATAGFRVLQKTKNIAVLLTCIQVLTVVLLGMILLALVGLLYTTNPDLERERRLLVSPVLRWIAEWLFTYGETASWLIRASIVISTASIGLLLFESSSTRTRDNPPEEDDSERGRGEEC